MQSKDVQRIVMHCRVMENKDIQSKMMQNKVKQSKEICKAKQSYAKQMGSEEEEGGEGARLNY